MQVYMNVIVYSNMTVSHDNNDEVKVMRSIVTSKTCQCKAYSTRAVCMEKHQE